MTYFQRFVATSAIEEVESFPMWEDYTLVLLSALGCPLVRLALEFGMYKVSIV
jgi:hypothetical protein